MYQQYLVNGVLASGIIRVADMGFIPNDPANRDWQIYQAWVAQGNTPLPPA